MYGSPVLPVPSPKGHKTKNTTSAEKRAARKEVSINCTNSGQLHTQKLDLVGWSGHQLRIIVSSGNNKVIINLILESSAHTKNPTTKQCLTAPKAESESSRTNVHGTCCAVFGAATHQVNHTPSIAFRHLPPNSASFSYATEGALFISAQLSSDAGNTLQKVPVLIWL